MHKLGSDCVLHADDDKLPLQNIDFNCIICMELLISPVSLECGHTMCLMCCEQLIKRVCPVCRRNIAAPSKNVLLCNILKAIHGPDYAYKCEKSEMMKKYYGGNRFDMLCDVVTDSISNGELNPCDPEHKGIFITVHSLIKSLVSESINNIRYIVPEVKLCIHKLIREKHIVQCKNYMLLNAKDWILDRVIKYESVLSEQELLFMISGIIKSELSDELGTSLKKRRRCMTTVFIDDIDETEKQLFNCLREKKIEV